MTWLRILVVSHAAESSDVAARLSQLLNRKLGLGLFVGLKPESQQAAQSEASWPMFSQMRFQSVG